METGTKERWIELCELASVEQQPDKLLKFVTEINRLLSEKDARRKGNNPSRKPVSTRHPFPPEAEKGRATCQESGIEQSSE